MLEAFFHNRLKGLRVDTLKDKSGEKSPQYYAILEIRANIYSSENPHSINEPVEMRVPLLKKDYEELLKFPEHYVFEAKANLSKKSSN